MLQELVREHVNTGHHKILLNLREVTYINSSGIAGLLASLNTVQGQGGELRICNMSKRVGEVLRRTCMDVVLNIDTDEPTALQTFSGEAPEKSLPKTVASAANVSEWQPASRSDAWTYLQCAPISQLKQMWRVFAHGFS